MTRILFGPIFSLTWLESFFKYFLLRSSIISLYLLHSGPRTQEYLLNHFHEKKWLWMSKFAPCWFGAPSSRAKACTQARGCLYLLLISWDGTKGFSLCSSVHKSSQTQNSNLFVDVSFIRKFQSKCFPSSMDLALQISKKKKAACCSSFNTTAVEIPQDSIPRPHHNGTAITHVGEGRVQSGHQLHLGYDTPLWI